MKAACFERLSKVAERQRGSWRNILAVVGTVAAAEPVLASAVVSSTGVDWAWAMSFFRPSILWPKAGESAWEPMVGPFFKVSFVGSSKVASLTMAIFSQVQNHRLSGRAANETTKRLW